MKASRPKLLPIASGAPPDARGVTPLIRAASAAPVIASRRGVEILDLPCRKILNRCGNEAMPFDWSINPYRGCEFACRYCYARYTHEYMGLEDPRLFETRLFAKTNAAEAFEAELPEGKILHGAVAIGTVTDPYQPAERNLRITRRLLESIAERRGLDVSITTKSDLVLRDVDLLREIAKANRIGVNVTITTFNRRLARLLEPRAPRPAKRIQTVKALAGAGIRTSVFIMPVLPGITDKAASLEAIVAAAARAGATGVAHQALFLRTSAKKTLLPFLAEQFPRQAPLYRKSYSGNVYYDVEYRKSLKDLMEALKRKYGLAGRGEAGAPAREPAADRLADRPSRRSPSAAARGAWQLALGF